MTYMTTTTVLVSIPYALIKRVCEVLAHCTSILGTQRSQLRYNLSGVVAVHDDSFTLHTHLRLYAF